MSFKGKLNIYTCQKCAGQFVTKDVDDGVTPFMTICRTTEGCKGFAESAFYRVDQTLTPQWEWYRPDLPTRSMLAPHALEHVNKGGLILRRATS